MAPSDDNARCGRCGQAFHCGMRDAVPCACASFKLTPAALAELRERYAGCLCPPCLAQWAADPPPADMSVSR